MKANPFIDLPLPPRKVTDSLYFLTKTKIIFEYQLYRPIYQHDTRVLLPYPAEADTSVNGRCLFWWRRPAISSDVRDH